MKNIIILLIVIFTTNIKAQELVKHYYSVSTIIKDTGSLDKNGLPIGTWKYYTKNTTLDYEINWDINFIKMYYTTGELKEEGTFIPETSVHIKQWITYCKDGKIDDKIVYDENGVALKN